MFCPNCGNSVPDDAKFCGECGTVIAEAEASMKKAKKSAFPPWIIAIIVILSLAVLGTAALLVYTIITENKAPDYAESSNMSESQINSSSDYSSSDSGSYNSSDTSSDTTSKSERKINPQYEKFYSDCNLTPPALSRVIATYEDYDKYAISLEGTIVDEYEVGYENGVAIEMYRYIYFTESYIAAYYQKTLIDENDLNAFKQMMTESEYYNQLLERKNVTVKMEIYGLNVVITERIVDLDDADNYKEMFNTDHPLSREEMQYTLKSNGYISKFIE